MKRELFDDLSIRAQNVAEICGATSVHKLSLLSRGWLAGRRGCGKKTLQEYDALLAANRLRFSDGPATPPPGPAPYTTVFLARAKLYMAKGESNART